MITTISESGVQIVTGHSCAFGDEITVRWLREEEPFEAQCVVRNIQDQQVGLEFRPTQANSIRDFVNGSKLSPNGLPSLKWLGNDRASSFGCNHRSAGER
jgi:hypothetical protein